MNRRAKSYFSFILMAVLLFIITEIFSQVIDNQFIKKITSSEGLSHNVINDIVQDDHGFIWIATQDRLNRFDGFDFKIYMNKPGDSTSISGNYIRSLYLDKKNNLWISTRYGLNLYDPYSDTFRRFELDGNNELDITKITNSKDSNLWISNYAGGFHYFDVGKKSFTDFNSDNLTLKSDYVMTIHEDSHGMLWIGTADKGVQVFRISGSKPFPADDITSRLQAFNISRIEIIFEDGNSNIWIGSQEGILLYNRSLDEVFLIQKSANPQGLSDNIILDISQNYQGNILIGTQEGGLNILSQDQIKANNPGLFFFSKILPGPEAYNLSYRSVQTIFEDKDKNLWLGTFGNGLNMIPAIQPKFRLLKHNSENPQSLNFDKVWGICEDKDGFLWIGTDGRGLNRYDFITGAIKQYYSGDGLNDLSDDAVLSALCDSKGRLWFGTYAGGLNLYNKNSDGFVHFKTGNSNSSLPVNDIRCIFESSDGIIWLGTNGGGLVRLNDEDFTFESVILQANGIVAYDIRSISEDREGRLWLGTYGTGLYYYQPETGEVNRLAFDRGNSGTLNCNIIYTLLYDEKNNLLWIGGSQNGGLNRLDLENFTFTVYDNNYGLANNNINGIENDTEGRIWVSTNAGISLFYPDKEEFMNFNRFDGVQEKEFSNGSVLKSEIHDIICFGGSGGLNYFSPEKIEKQSKETAILITELKISDQVVDVKSSENSESILSTTMLYTEKISLNYKQDIFTIGFCGLHFANPQKIMYQYNLEGTDLSWNNLENQRHVTFRNLKPGDYEFRVRASDEDGVWSNSFGSLYIQILPPPWKSWWAYVIYALVIGSIILWIYFYNLKEAKIRHNLLIEKKLRAQENEFHEERIRFFTNIAHELRTPLMLLVNPLEDLLSKESPFTPLGRTFNVMYRSAGKLLRLTNTLLEFRKSETGKLKLSVSEGNLAELLEENCIAFKGLAKNKNIDLVFESGEKNINAWFDREKAEMIVGNLLSNAIKNINPYKKIFARISTGPADKDFPEGFVIIEIEDEGTGIPENQLDKIFESFYQVKGGITNSGTGIGLTLTKSLVELHKGRISVKSTLNKGTSFSVILPLGKGLFTEDEISVEKAMATDLKSLEIEMDESTNINMIIDLISSLSADKKKILIVEDNYEIRNYLKDLVKDYFIVVEAEDGEKGLDAARAVHPAIILSDVMMPGLDGIELCRLIKSESQTSHIPVILISANLTHHMHIDSLESGADAYLTKPFKPDLLITRIYNLLKSREKLQEYYLRKFQGDFSGLDNPLSKDDKFLMQLNKVIQSNLNNSSFSIELLHEEFDMSRTVFYHKIKSLTNFSPIELIRQIRLKKAADLLLTGNYKVYEVMYQVGFNDDKHFRQLFRKQFGVAPSEYLNLGSAPR